MGLLGNLGNMGDMLNQARELQKNLGKIKDELKRQTYTGESRGVKVIVNGEMEIKEVISNDKDANSFKEAANLALSRAKEDAAHKLKQAAGGLSIPGLT